MSALDVTLVVVLIACAVAYLAWMVGGNRAPPPCHMQAGARRKNDDVPVVLMGDSLARAVERVRARR
jgi:hypothetical protein